MAKLQASGQSVETQKLSQNFISDEVVYFIQMGHSNFRKSYHGDLKRYLNGDVWFKILLNIYTGGHLGKYIATVTSTGRFRHLDNARKGR